MIERGRRFGGDEVVSEPRLSGELFDDRIREVGKAGGKKKVERGTSARNQLEVYLSMPPGESRNRVMEGFLARRGDKLNVDDLKRAAQSFVEEVPTATRIAAPPASPTSGEPLKTGMADREKLKDPDSLMLYMRQKAIEFIEDASEAKLNYATVEAEIKLGLGWNRDTMAKIDLFDQLSAEKKEKVKELVKVEINARCELKVAQLKDKSLRKPEVEKAEARKQTVAGAGEIDRDTHRWLASVADLGERGGITAEKVDQAFSVLVLLGEGFPDPPKPWMRDFVSFVKAPDRKDPRKTKGFWDPAYPVETKEGVFVLLREKFGPDAANVAHQLFDAYKLEGKYNWDHYLNGLYSYAATRSVLTVLEKPVYLGSQRKYKDPEFVEKRTSLQRGLFEARSRNVPDEIGDIEQQMKALGYGAEIQRLGMSPLDVKASDKYIDDPKIPGAKKGNEELGLYMEKVKEGMFLRGTSWTDNVLVAYLPQEISVVIVKAGDKFSAAVASIGGLGAEGDRKTRVDAAVKSVSEMRSAGINLVATGTNTPEEIDKQINEEVLNILWELSLYNDFNLDMVEGKPNFLLETQLNDLFVKLGGIVDGVPIIGSDDQYVKIRELIEGIKKRTWKRAEGWLGDDRERQEEALKHIDLPRERQRGARPKPKGIVEAILVPLSKVVTAPLEIVDKVRKKRP